MSEKSLTEALDALKTLHDLYHGAKGEVEHLRAIQTWALDQLPVKAEDAVVLKKTFPRVDLNRNSGWWIYREALVPGATGVVERVDYNGHYGYWQAVVRFDAMWSVSEWGRGDMHRYSKDGLFWISVKHLRLRRKGDVTPTMPEGTKIVRGDEW